MRNKVISLEESASLIPDAATVSISGAWMLVPDSTLKVIGDSFLTTGHPRDLTAIFAICPGGTPDQPGIEHLAHPGLLQRVIGGSFPNLPESPLRKLILENQMGAYNLPSGMIASWFRSVGAGHPGAFSRAGLGTFIDPRLEGGGMNRACAGRLVSVVNLNDREYLFFPSAPVDVSIIRATTADRAGNLSMEREPATLTAFVQAAAARASGGKVIAQVEKVVETGTLPPHNVKVPGTFVDYVVVDPNPLQAGGIRYDPSLCGEIRKPLEPMTARSNSDRWLARRALQEIHEGDVVVLGYGISALIPHLLLEAGQFEKAVFAIEQGSIGGLPLINFGFGSSMNPQAILDATSQFETFQGGCFDRCMLSFLQVDPKGRVNVHRLDSHPSLSVGIGGFLDIAANAQRIAFIGYFTAGGLRTDIRKDELQILKEGCQRKFVEHLEHVSFDPAYSRATEALYITERAVFRWSKRDALTLIEVAPGVDLARDVLNQMEFQPNIGDLKSMEMLV